MGVIVCLDTNEREHVDPSFTLETFWTRIGNGMCSVLFDRWLIALCYLILIPF